MPNNDEDRNPKPIGGRDVVEKLPGRRILEACLAFPFLLVDRLGTFIGWAIVGYVFVYLPVKALAGNDTTVVVDALANLAINDWVYWLAIAVLSGGHIVREGAFRRYVRTKGQREKELEQLIDPNRTSSGLAPDGTRPKELENGRHGD